MTSREQAVGIIEQCLLQSGGNYAARIYDALAARAITGVSHE